MCLAAIYWARIKRIAYGCTRQDAAAIEFDDEEIYSEVAAPITRRRLPMKQMLRKEALVAFQEWERKSDRVRY
jgi:tRNA(Arg) A34 adenosine deaminase TadA